MHRYNIFCAQAPLNLLKVARESPSGNYHKSAQIFNYGYVLIVA